MLTAGEAMLATAVEAPATDVGDNRPDGTRVPISEVSLFYIGATIEMEVMQ